MTSPGLEHYFWTVSSSHSAAFHSSNDFDADDSLGQLTVTRKTEDSQESNMASDVLSASGVRYRHRNSDVVTSRVARKAEEQFVKVGVLYEVRCFIRPRTKWNHSGEGNLLRQSWSLPHLFQSPGLRSARNM
jgi:hypothetical protein